MVTTHRTHKYFSHHHKNSLQSNKKKTYNKKEVKADEQLKILENEFPDKEIK